MAYRCEPFQHWPQLTSNQSILPSLMVDVLSHFLNYWAQTMLLPCAHIKNIFSNSTYLLEQNHFIALCGSHIKQNDSDSIYNVRKRLWDSVLLVSRLCISVSHLCLPVLLLVAICVYASHRFSCHIVAGFLPYTYSTRYRQNAFPARQKTDQFWRCD